MTDPTSGGALAQLVPPELRELLRGQDLALRRPIWGQHQGRHRSRKAGVGHEFRDHRPYAPGDDLRMLDWRAAGRRDGLVLRQAEAEQDLSLALVIDAGGGMSYGDGDAEKWRVAGSFAGALGWLAQRQGDGFGFVAGRDGETDHSALRPSASRSRSRSLAQAFVERGPLGRCPWTEVLASLPTKLARRSLVVVISDLWDVADAANADPDVALDRLLHTLGHLRARDHDVVLVQVLHRDEIGFPWKERRVYRFEDLAGTRPAVEGPAASLRDEYLERATAYLDAVEKKTEAAGLFLHRVVTDEPVADGFLELASRLAGGGPRAGQEAHR